MVQKVPPPKAQKRGRPPQYDADTALAAARDAFWRSGFQATSLDDLTIATGMNRPSLYNAFGDKHALFVEALKRYRATNVTVARGVLDAAPTLRAGLSEIYARAIALYLGDKARGGGCFILGTATVEAETDPEARAELDGINRDLDAAFLARMKRAQAEGELAASVDVAQRARLATGIIHTLSLRARAHEGRAALKSLADAAAELLSS